MRLKISNLSKTYPNGVKALKNLSHEYNVARMIEATKKGLDYFSKNFGPYQFRQFRILEFPRYRSFAQSFPNTVPYSEGLGLSPMERRKTTWTSRFT